MNPENVLKGRMAEALVNELLRQAGHHVYRFGYEAVLQNLTQIEQKALYGDSDIVRQIRSIPDFLCVKDNKPFFVEVKFRSVWKYQFDKNTKEDRDDIAQLERINQFWKAKVIFVTVVKPYFRILRPPYFDTDLKVTFSSVEDDKDLDITVDILPEFNRLVEKYLISTKGRRND